MLLKSVYQWDIDSADDLAKFREDSGQMTNRSNESYTAGATTSPPASLWRHPRCKAPQENGKSAR